MDGALPVADGALARNGYALLSDLEDAGYQRLIGALEGFQADFLARTRPLWSPDFPIPGDALTHFSRQWEFPYAWTNLAGCRGRVLDAGSGLTFFPFLLAAAGFRVDCCDNDAILGLSDRFEHAVRLTGTHVDFTAGALEEEPFPDATFDGIACISVLEHLGRHRGEAARGLVRMLKPGGRLVLTCDIDLRRRDGMFVEDLALLLAELTGACEPAFPVDLRRPAELLTSDSFIHSAPWRLPWTWQPPLESDFRSVAVMGITMCKRDG